MNSHSTVEASHLNLMLNISAPEPEPVDPDEIEPTDSGDDGLVLILIMAIIGGFVFICLIIIAYCCIKRKKNK